jgi:sulfonate transport system substrate-binding protein
VTRPGGGVSRRLVLAAGPLLLVRPARAASPVLRMGDQRGNVRALMDAAGLLADLPYTVSWSEFAAAAPLAEALAAEAIDGGITGDAPFTFAFAGGVPIRAIATDRYDPQGTAIVVPGGSAITDTAGLHGRRVATGRGSIGHSLILAVMRQQGWSKSDLTIVFLQPADAKAALASGSIDAWSTWEPYTSQVEVLDGGRRVTSAAGLLPGLTYLAATVRAIGEKRPLLEDYVRRFAAARRWQAAHRPAYAARWAQLMGMDERVPAQWFTRAGDRIVPTDDAVMRDEQAVIDLYASAGLLHQRFAAADAFDASFNDAVRAGNATG